MTWKRRMLRRSIATAFLRAGCLPIRRTPHHCRSHRNRSTSSWGRIWFFLRPIKLDCATIERWNQPGNASDRANKEGHRRGLGWDHVARANFRRARLRRVASRQRADRNESFSRRSFLDGDESRCTFVASLHCASGDTGSEMPDRLNQ